MRIDSPHTAEILAEETPLVDYAYFAIWKDATPYISEIKAYLSKRFEILLETEIVWSKEHFRENAARLYEVPIFNSAKNTVMPVDHTHKIGATQFTVLVVKDTRPAYKYLPSVSGKIERSNSAVVEAKKVFRTLVAKTSTSKYAVHSSNNFEEFCFQVPLLLGVDNFKCLISGKKLELPSLKKDLEGAGGWKNAKSMFLVLNCATKYTVLRNFEDFPSIEAVDDIDFLTHKYQRLASVLGLKQKPTKPYKGTAQVEDKAISVDIRFVGDNYYCSAWATSILKNSFLKNGIYIPAADMYFFSLLYHVAVQKPEIDARYSKKLAELAKALKLDWFSTALVQDSQMVAKVLKGYMTARGYFYESPIDTAVCINKKIVSQLPKRATPVAKRSLKDTGKHTLLRFIPKSWYFYYLKLRTGKDYGFRE